MRVRFESGPVIIHGPSISPRVFKSKSSSNSVKLLFKNKTWLCDWYFHFVFILWLISSCSSPKRANRAMVGRGKKQSFRLLGHAPTAPTLNCFSLPTAPKYADPIFFWTARRPPMHRMSYFFDICNIFRDHVLFDQFYRENQNFKTVVTSEMPWI